MWRPLGDVPPRSPWARARRLIGALVLGAAGLAILHLVVGALGNGAVLVVPVLLLASLATSRFRWFAPFLAVYAVVLFAGEVSVGAERCIECGSARRFVDRRIGGLTWLRRRGEPEDGPPAWSGLPSPEDCEHDWRWERSCTYSLTMVACGWVPTRPVWEDDLRASPALERLAALDPELCRRFLRAHLRSAYTGEREALALPEPIPGPTDPEDLWTAWLDRVQGAIAAADRWCDRHSE